MSVSSGSVYRRPALSLGYTNQSLFLENSVGLLLLKQWLSFVLFSPSIVRPALYASGSGETEAGPGPGGPVLPPMEPQPGWLQCSVVCILRGRESILLCLVCFYLPWSSRKNTGPQV